LSLPNREQGRTDKAAKFLIKLPLSLQVNNKVLSNKKGARKKSELPKENGASSIQLQKYHSFDPIALPAEM
jgi:hypothetical protein